MHVCFAFTENAAFKVRDLSGKNQTVYSKQGMANKALDGEK